jgi:hypothetical protein
MLYLLTGYVLGDRNFFRSISNLLVFAEGEALFSFAQIVSLPSSVSAYSYILGANDFRDFEYYRLIGNTALARFLLETLKWVTVVFAMHAIVAYRDRVTARQMVCVLVAVITNMGVWAGGYSLIFYFPLIPILAQMRYWKTYMGLLALIYGPLDLVNLVPSQVGTQMLPIYLTHRRCAVDIDRRECPQALPQSCPARRVGA